MKNNKILTALGFTSATDSNKNKTLTKRLVQASALTLACFVSMPSFAQKEPMEPITVIGEPIDVPWWWGGLGGGGNGSVYDGGCNNIGCDSGDDYGDSSNVEVCSAFEAANLRNLKQNTPGCHGDPGDVFDTAAWFAQETGSFWNWLTNPLGIVWYDSMLGPITWLANALDANNGDQYAVYDQFESMMWTQACANVWGETVGDVNDSEHGYCLWSVYYILETYEVGSNVTAVIANWLFGTDFSTAEYDQTWGGRLVEDVQNFAACRDIYDAWDEENCGGNL